MEPGDLIVSPAGTVHDHHNGGSEPAVWLDASDAGLLSVTGADVPEPYPLDDQYQTIGRPADYFTATRARMADPSAATDLRRPPARYPWVETFATLTSLKEGEAGTDPYDGIALTYASPADRGPALPTFACGIQL